jgi:pilus assembly protein CpaE
VAGDLGVFPERRCGALEEVACPAGAHGLAAVNAAVALARSPTYRVALVDLSVEFANTAMLLDVQPRRTLTHLGGVNVAELDPGAWAPFVAEHPSGVRLVVGCDTPARAELVTVPTVQQLLDRLRAEMDYIIVDTAPTFTEITLAAIDAADAVCLVTTPHLVALKASRDCAAVLDQLRVAQDRRLLVLNRTVPHGLADERVAEYFGRKPDVVIPHTPALDQAADAGAPWMITRPGDVTAIKFQELAARAAARVPARA